MQAGASTFIHILAFQCPQCEKPIVEWMLSPMRSPESIDGATFNLKCSCGWSDGWLGAQARRHLVLPMVRLRALRRLKPVPRTLNRHLTTRKRPKRIH